MLLGVEVACIDDVEDTDTGLSDSVLYTEDTDMLSFNMEALGSTAALDMLGLDIVDTDTSRVVNKSEWLAEGNKSVG